MNMRQITVSIVLVLLVSCRQAPQEPPRLLPGVIFTVEQTEKYMGATGTPTTGAWLPSQAQVEDLEARLPLFLELMNVPPTRKLRDSLSTYRRQYLGFVENGRHIIFVNFFCPHYSLGPADRWKQELIFVADGGLCYFQVCYDPESKLFFRLVWNSVA
jgi:hypothetical protein